MYLYSCRVTQHIYLLLGFAQTQPNLQLFLTHAKAQCMNARSAYLRSVKNKVGIAHPTITDEF